MTRTPFGTQFRLRLISRLFLLALAVAGCIGAEARAPGRIELSAQTFDFGTVPNTEPVSQTFQVRNVGRGPLEILAVSTSCACTSAAVGRHRVAPGETSDLTVTYDPQVHGGTTGEFLRVVYVRSDDPDTREAELRLRVNVVEE